MSKIIDEKTEVELRSILKNLIHPVKLIYFTQKQACPTCIHQIQILEELTSLSDKLELVVFDLVINGDEAMKYGVDKIPATVVIGDHDLGIRFYGVTAGYEFTSLLESVVMVSTGRSGLESRLESLVADIKERVHIQVIVTLTCPVCPRMVHVADQFAFVNSNISADMIEGSEFPHLVQKYKVTGVPTTIINETHVLEGATPSAVVYLEILKAVDPEEYNKLQEAIREAQGRRKVRRVEIDNEYEVLIIGGGPAALSAALYAARKDLDVALVAGKLGGQIAYTANIDNYLGLPATSGTDMVERFRDHAESYPVAEELGATLSSLKKLDNVFEATMEDGRRLKALTVIYCAGKEYGRLNVPGEDRFIGRGIGFCATCDAPLYRDKKVAVIGGGNSAFTAARDLIDFASEIHLIHRRKEFRADPPLVEEVLKAKNVTVHTPVMVLAFEGKDKLTRIRLTSVNDSRKYDLDIDGVFLGIGLTPNTKPLEGLIALNKSHEVPVNKDQSTEIEGLFAAGDVTDVEEKQVSIAVGQGALAAISAHKYLVKNRLTKSKISLKESWQ